MKAAFCAKNALSSGRKRQYFRPKVQFWLVRPEILSCVALFGATVFCIIGFPPKGSKTYFMKEDGVTWRRDYR
jgi:hypothetical protein